MADASANPRAIAVGFGRHSERDHVSDLFAPPANELRAQRPTVLIRGARPSLHLCCCWPAACCWFLCTLRRGHRPPEPVLFLLLHAPLTGGGA